MTTDQTRPASGELALRAVTKQFPSRGSVVTAVDNVDLVTAPGEFVTLLGPSGCGKTTTLRMVAGFETPTSGSISLDGVDMVRLTPDKRPMSMVFQSYALFPHLTVRQNIAYGPRLQRLGAAEIDRRVGEVLESMGLTHLADRAPAQMSGGQQQRVALARAMVMRPTVLLFDEPLSNLDAKLRVQMRTEIRRLQREMGITALYVTHDQDEAMALSDRIVVMNAGRIEQRGRPDEIYRHPATVFVADFIGQANFLTATVNRHGEGEATVSVLGTQRTLPAAPAARDAAEHVVLVRPESVQVTPAEQSEGITGNHGRIRNTIFYGSTVEYEITTAAGRMVAVVCAPDPDRLLAPGAEVLVDFPRDRGWLLPAAQS